MPFLSKHEHVGLEFGRNDEGNSYTASLMGTRSGGYPPRVIGPVTLGDLRPEGWCCRKVFENPADRGGHCMEPVAWVGR